MSRLRRRLDRNIGEVKKERQERRNRYRHDNIPEAKGTRRNQETKCAENRERLQKWKAMKHLSYDYVAKHYDPRTMI